MPKARTSAGPVLSFPHLPITDAEATAVCKALGRVKPLSDAQRSELKHLREWTFHSIVEEREWVTKKTLEKQVACLRRPLKIVQKALLWLETEHSPLHSALNVHMQLQLEEMGRPRWLVHPLRMTLQDLDIALSHVVSAAVSEDSSRGRERKHGPLRAFVLRFADIYEDLTGQRPTANFDGAKGKIRTPFVRAVGDVANALEIPLSVDRKGMGDFVRRLLREGRRCKGKK